MEASPHHDKIVLKDIIQFLYSENSSRYRVIDYLNSYSSIQSSELVTLVYKNRSMLATLGIYINYSSRRRPGMRIKYINYYTLVWTPANCRYMILIEYCVTEKRWKVMIGN